MSRVTIDNEALKVWINNDPKREALLMDKAVISASTLVQLKNGSYRPSTTLANAIKEIMARYPLNKIFRGPPEAA